MLGDVLTRFDLLTWWLLAPPAAIAAVQVTREHYRMREIGARPDAVQAVIHGLLMYPVWILGWAAVIGVPAVLAWDLGTALLRLLGWR